MIAIAATIRRFGFCLEIAIRNPVATTITAVPILRDRAVLATDVFALAFKIIRMTAGTIGLEGRVRPVDRLRVVLMALGAGEVAAVIKRLVRQAGMPVRVRDPGDGAVALVALLR